MKDLKIPQFETGAEESKWWEENEVAIGDAFEESLEQGFVGSATLVITGDSKVTRVTLDPDDIARARVQAAERGLRYQTYLKMIIHEALRSVDSAHKSTKP